MPAKPKESIQNHIIVTDGNHRLTGVDSYTRTLFYEIPIEGLSLNEFLKLVHPKLPELYEENITRDKNWTSQWNDQGIAHSLNFERIRQPSGYTYSIQMRIRAAESDVRKTSPQIDELIANPEKVLELYLKFQKSEARLESYMRHFPGIFFNQRADFSFQYISPNCERVLDMASNRLLKSGSLFLGMIFEQDRDFFLSEIKKQRADSGAFTIQYRIRKPRDQSVLYLTDVRSPIYSPSGALLGYEGVWLDTTRQVIAERKLTSSAWKENLGLLTAGLVHDFSNVMAGIYALSELYHSQIDEQSEMFEGLGQIKKSSMEARKLVRRIIDINREETGSKNYHDPSKLIREQLDLLQIIFPRGTSLDLKLCEEEIPVYIDDVEFRQILLNLAMNSKDALDKSGAIRISTERIHANVSCFATTQGGPRKIERDGILISFSDNGTGIPANYRDRIFNSFFSTKEIHKGSGFGLYNIKRIVKGDHGHIDFETTIGGGTTFYIYLPEADFTETLVDNPNGADNTAAIIEERPEIVILSSSDVSQFDLISLLRNRSWEVISFASLDRMEAYLRDSKGAPKICLIIDVHGETDLESVNHLVTDLKPSTQLAWLPMGQNPDEIDRINIEKYATLCDGSQGPMKLIQFLEQLINSPITKA